MSLFRNAATVFTSSALAVPLGLVGNLVLARYLSVPDRGAYGLALNFASMAFVVAQLGLPTAVIFENRRAGCPPARLMTTHFAASVATGALGVLGCLLLPRAWREALLPGVSGGAYALATWIVPTLVVGEFLRAVARALDRFDLYNAFTVLQPIGIAAALLGSLVLAGGGLRAALWSYLGVQLALVAGLAALLYRMAGAEQRIHPAEILRALRYGLVAYGQNVLLYLQERLELFLLAYLIADSAQVGLFVVALSAVNPLRLLPDSLSVAVFPDLASREAESAARTAALLARHSVALLLLLGAAAAPIVPWVVPAFFGATYAAAVPTVLWLLPKLCVLAASRLLARYFQAVDQQRVLLVARVLAVLTNGVLCLRWIPASGIVGAAQASLAANALEAALVAAAFCYATGIPAREAFAPRRADLEPYRTRALGLARRVRSGAALR